MDHCSGGKASHLILTLDGESLPPTLSPYQAHQASQADTAAQWLSGITLEKTPPDAAAPVLEKLAATPYVEPSRIAAELRAIFVQPGWNVSGPVYQSAGDIHVHIGEQQKPETQSPSTLARTFHGKVVKLREGPSRPVANANVTLEQTGEVVTSNSAGLFFVPLSPEFLEGEEIKFNIDVPGYAIFQPVEGRTRIPQQLQKDVVIFELLPRGSPKFFSHEHLTALLKSAAEKSTEQVREQNKEKVPPELGRYLKDWALQYGFGIEQVKAEVDRWVGEVEQKQANSYELGLAAFAKKNFTQAGSLFQESASHKERKLLQAREREQQLLEETIRDYGLAGDAHYNDYNFPKAFELYQKALSLADRVRTPRLWAASPDSLRPCSVEARD